MWGLGQIKEAFVDVAEAKNIEEWCFQALFALWTRVDDAG
jgi:hypothetical protein